MFERRLKFLLVLLTLPAVAIVLRLVQLQAAHGGDYQRRSEALLRKPARFFPCLRGNITDHEGRERLAYDAPAWSICVPYRLIAGDRDYLRGLARRRHPQLDPSAAEDALQEEITASWYAVAAVGGKSLSDLEATARKIRAEVQAVKRVVSQRRGVPTEVAEEVMAHPVVRNLDQGRQVTARDKLRGYEWVEIVADQARRYGGGPACGHFIGRLGEVAPEDIRDDPNRDDELARYLSGDLHGVTGVEALGERQLRGRRGRIEEDRLGRLVPGAPVIEPQNGKNFRLTIDIPLQQECYQLLQATVESSEHGTGGAAVILDVPSREVLAMISYPGHDPNITWKEWLALAGDELRQPTRFRPLEMHYPPGSIVKPMLLAGGLTDGTITPETRFTCEGRLFREDENHWRCLAAHGSIDPVFAIQHSCNVFFYHLGELMRVPRETYWLQQFGFGTVSGAGLTQETPGSLPRGSSNGIARQVGIGHTFDITPMQAANMAACIASGVYRPVTIWADDPNPRPGRRLPVSDAAWRLVREGMYRAVNVYGGTIFEHGRIDDAGDYILVGKTGSATGLRRVAERLYTVHLPDGGVREEPASSEREVQARYPGARIAGGRPCKYWPAPEVDPTHAWCIGYLTTKQRYLESNNAGRLNVAIAVIVEYGGHGGTGASPAAAEMMRRILARQQDAGAEGERR